MVIGLAFGYADGMTPWMRQTISTSLAVAAMVKCGVTHPPGASAALLFSAGKHTWFNFLFIMIGNVIAILCATAINNASEARQFPSYWGFSIFFSPNNVFRDRFTKPLKNA